MAKSHRQKRRKLSWKTFDKNRIGSIQLRLFVVKWIDIKCAETIIDSWLMSVREIHSRGCIQIMDRLNACRYAARGKDFYSTFFFLQDMRCVYIQMYACVCVWELSIIFYRFLVRFLVRKQADFVYIIKFCYDCK